MSQVDDIYAQSVGFTILQGRVRQNRILNLRQSLEQICGSAGWTVSQYWVTALEEAVRGEDFKDLLCVEVKHQNTLHRGAITKAFEAALRGKAPWISSETDGSIVIADPDAAIEWFLSSSRRRDLIPKDLADIVVPPSSAPSTKEKPQPKTIELIQDAAGKLGKTHGDFAVFEEYRRAICEVAGVDPNARGWSEDSIRRALRDASAAN
jgi:hypothetical protein